MIWRSPATRISITGARCPVCITSWRCWVVAGFFLALMEKLCPKCLPLRCQRSILRNVPPFASAISGTAAGCPVLLRIVRHSRSGTTATRCIQYTLARPETTALPTLHRRINISTATARSMRWTKMASVAVRCFASQIQKQCGLRSIQSPTL